MAYSKYVPVPTNDAHEHDSDSVMSAPAAVAQNSVPKDNIMADRREPRSEDDVSRSVQKMRSKLDALNDNDTYRNLPTLQEYLRQTDPSSPDTINLASKASLSGSVLNLANTVIGAGVLAMPKAFVSTGLFNGVVLIFFSAFVSGLGLYFLTRCAARVEAGQASFFSIARRTYPSAAIWFDSAIVIKCFGVGVSYLIVIADLTPEIMLSLLPAPVKYQFLIDRKFWILVSMIIITPLSFFRKLDSLKYVSAVALVAIGYLLVIVVTQFLFGSKKLASGTISYFAWSSAPAFLRALPVFVFSFTCHQNIFSIINEIRDKRHWSLFSVILMTMLISSFVYTMVGVAGYLTFGSVVSGNIISMYASSISTTIARVSLMLLTLLSFPLQCHPCRASLEKVVQSFGHRICSRENRFVVLTSIILISSAGVALSVRSLEIVLAYVGATGSTSISFILPGLLYWKLITVEQAQDEDEQALLNTHSAHSTSLSSFSVPSSVSGWSKFMSRQFWRSSDGRAKKYLILRRLALALATYGFLVMIVCLSLNIMGKL